VVVLVRKGLRIEIASVNDGRSGDGEKKKEG
jgi:hypothetical protein